MPVLTSQQRKTLEDACTKGRRASEQAVRGALTSLAVTAERPPTHLNEDDRQLRRGLRAKARQLGDQGDSLDLLIAECAYEQWHRLLFARFLAENNLLIHPEYRAPVTLVDCEELAESLGEPDGWSVAARFAAEILPGIFRLDDPCVRLSLAPEGRLALEGMLAALPTEIFAADDALGWVYQFWQKDKKDEVNASERKIGGADLGPVTQLFTENYMVRFLLENTLGAWWAARHPDSPLVKTFEYLRVNEKGEPAVGTFDDWPEVAREVTVMDPCCGSGHFLVEAFLMLWQMRVEEEGWAPTDAQDAVLRENLFGLELDARCVQIAMFAMALQAWKAGGAWRLLPVPNIACAGIPVRASVDEWKALADGDARLETALTRLHVLFRDADTLGSLIDPRLIAEVSNPGTDARSFDDVEWDEIAPLLNKAVARERSDPATAVLGADAVGIARAADYLTRNYTIVVTNVPYLGRTRQSPLLAGYVDRRFPVASADLSVAVLARLRGLVSSTGCCAAVSPQAWLFQKFYRGFRELILENDRVVLVARLGAGAFDQISGDVVNVCLTLTCGDHQAQEDAQFIDAESGRGSTAKSRGLQETVITEAAQASQLANPMAIINGLDLSRIRLIGDVADSYQGISTGDSPRFARRFWEVRDVSPERWWYMQGTTPRTIPYGGRSSVVWWQSDSGELRSCHERTDARIRGRDAWGRQGVALSQMGSMPVTFYSGDLFDNSSTAVIPRDPADLLPLFCYLGSDAFREALRQIAPKMSVEVATVQLVPFDVDSWRRTASERFPDGLPEPRSYDPTQWLFDGCPDTSTEPLQVAVARLLGYPWPEQPEADELGAFSDVDGIVCLPSVAGEPPAADRLQQVLGAAFGPSWSPAKQKELLEETGSKKKNLGDWLRDDFFKQHCTLFGHRPFVWHIWDGQRDGFAALVNYHRLDRKTLEKLTYTYLGDWIERQRAEVRDEKPGAEARFAAASQLRSSLELILDGEPPYDIYVRWKALAEQPIGWDPDVNDGVRVNVRPFVEAGVLRSSFKIHWRKDRGKNPDGSERLNDLHFTTAEKRAARGCSA